MGHQLCRIAWFTVTKDSGALSLSASRLVLPLLREQFEIEVFSDSAGTVPGIGSVDHYLNAVGRHTEAPFDLFFYQLEDIPAANFIKIHLGLMPGVVWFHHVVLGCDIPEPIMNSPCRPVLERFRLPEGQWPTARWPERLAEHKFRGPLAWRELQYSLAPIFSTEWAHGEFRRMGEEGWAVAPRRPSTFVSLPVAAEHWEMPVAPPASELRVGLVGAPRIECRTHKVLQAVAESDAPMALTWLVPSSDVAAAEAQLQEFGIAGGRVIGDLSPERWQQELLTLDCAVHTLYSVYGQVGPYLDQSLAAGRTCVVSDFGSCEYLPDNVVCKVAPGDHEVYQYRRIFTELSRARSSAASALQSENARAFALERSHPRVVAGDLALFLTTERAQLAARLARWTTFRNAAAQDLLLEIRNHTGPTESDRNTAWRAFGPWFEELGWGGRGSGTKIGG